MLTPSLMSSSHHINKMNLSKVVIPSIGSVFAFAVTLFSLIFILKRNTWLKNGKVKFPGGTPEAHFPANGRYLLQELRDESVQLITSSARSNKWRHVPLSPISVFGIGGGICLTCIFILQMYPSPHDINIAVNMIALLISLIIQIIFFAYYDGAVLKYSEKIWIWVAFTLFALPEISPGNSPVTCTNISPLSISLNMTNISPLTNDKIVSASLVLKLFLEPFYMEFLTVSVTALIQLWNLMTKEQDDSVKMFTAGNRVSPSNERDEGRGASEDISLNIEEMEERLVPEINDADDNEERESLCDEDNSLPSRQVQKRTRVKRLEKLVTVMFVAFLTITAISEFLGEQILYVGPLHTLVEGKVKPSVAHFLFRGIYIAVYTPYFLLCIITIHKLYRISNSTRFGPAPFNSSDYLLIFTTTVIFAWEVMKIVAAGISLSRTIDHLNSTENTNTDDNMHESVTKNGAMFMLVYDTLTIIMVWLQSQVILAAHSFHRLGYSNSKLTKVCLAYVIALNIPQWLQGALDRENLMHQHNYFTPELNSYIDEVTVRMLTYILFPIMVFNKFHSAVMAYEIMK